VIFEADSQAIRWANALTEPVWRGRAVRAVGAAVATGIPEVLAGGPATAETVAGARGLVPDVVEKVLIVLAALGLAERTGRGWRLTERGRATLLAEAPLYQGNLLIHQAQVEVFWTDLESALRGRGPDRWVRAEGGEPRIRSWRDFVLAMHNLAMAGRAAAFCERVDLAGRRSLVDVGGGPGSYAMALCERYPDLQATILDLPEAVAVARDLIARFGMGGRVRVEAGDWNEVEFGTGRDVVLLSNVLHGPESGAEMKLAKAHRALVPGGLLVVQDFLLNAEKTGPLIPAVFNLMVGAFSVPEMVERITSAGFAEPAVRPMPEAFGTTVLVAEKPA